MTSVTQPDLGEGDGATDVVALPYALSATYERDEGRRALQWAKARSNRWRAVVDTRLSAGPVGTTKAAVRLYAQATRERQEYVQRLIERGRRDG